MRVGPLKFTLSFCYCFGWGPRAFFCWVFFSGLGSDLLLPVGASCLGSECVLSSRSLRQVGVVTSASLAPVIMSV